MSGIGHAISSLTHSLGGLGAIALPIAAAFLGPEVFAGFGGLEAGAAGVGAAAGEALPWGALSGAGMEAAAGGGALGALGLAPEMSMATDAGYLSGLSTGGSSLMETLTGAAPMMSMATDASYLSGLSGFADSGGSAFGVPEVDLSTPYSGQSSSDGTLLDSLKTKLMNPMAAGKQAMGGANDFFTQMLRQMGLPVGGANGPMSNLWDIGSSLYNFNQAQQLQSMGKNLGSFGPMTSGWGQQMSALLADPSSVQNLPGYKFQYDQGLQALQRSMASQGYDPTSGNFATASQQYGQGLAQSFYNQQLAALQGAIGTGTQATTAGAGIEASGMKAAAAALSRLGYGGLGGMRGWTNG